MPHRRQRRVRASEKDDGEPDFARMLKLVPGLYSVFPACVALPDVAPTRQLVRLPGNAVSEYRAENGHSHGKGTDHLFHEEECSSPEICSTPKFMTFCNTQLADSVSC
jgi:hypothetical protein